MGALPTFQKVTKNSLSPKLGYSVKNLIVTRVEVMGKKMRLIVTAVNGSLLFE